MLFVINIGNKLQFLLLNNNRIKIKVLQSNVRELLLLMRYENIVILGLKKESRGVHLRVANAEPLPGLTGMKRAKELRGEIPKI